MLFAWDDWNIEHASKHDVVPSEAEFVLERARRPWPQQTGSGKFIVWGPTREGRLLQVIFALKSPDEVEFDALAVDEWADLGEDDRIVYVVHAMELTAAMKRQYRKRKR